MRRVRTSALPVIAIAMALTACSSGASAGGDAEADGATIEHVFGETVVPADPEAVATIGWGSEDAAIALGIVPAGMPLQTWGGEESGMMLWTQEALADMGAETPVLYDETDGVDFEAINDLEPDVILATYSGITEDEYATLSQIAPTVAYPDVPWATPWRDVITTTGTALGLEQEGRDLVADLDQQLADAVAEHPEIEGLDAAFTYSTAADLGTIGIYSPADPRVQLLEDLGMQSAPSVSEAVGDSESFFVDVSAEQADMFDDVDILFAYGDESLLEAMQADPLFGTIPAVANGAVVLLPEATPLANSVSPPTAVSLSWALEDYMDLVAEAAANVE